MMEGPIKAGAARTLQIDMHGRAQGSDALAKLIVAGSIAPDAFVPVTPGPMMTVLRAGKAALALPVARTEMVIAYSPKSTYARQFADAAAGKRGSMPWWRILQQRDLRFGRTDPTVDPQGRNIIFTLQLAEAYYKQPGLAQSILGQTINPAQIFSEPTVEARLQSGELDAAAAYKIQPGPFNLPFVSLPAEINLGSDALRDRYAQQSLDIGGAIRRPEPLVYYAAVLDASPHRDKAAAFVDWLRGSGQAIFRRYFYDPPAGMSPLRA
jgi:molybdate/tungstate transport system substrate-binding protein